MTVKVKMNSEGIEAVLSSSGVQADLMRRGMAIKSAADSVGSGRYVCQAKPGRKGGRPYVVVAVPPGDWETWASNNKHKTLQNAKGAGR